MKLYFSTFISGTQEIIEDILKKRSGKFKIKFLLDGLVIYESSYPEREIRNLRFFNNTFLLLRSFEYRQSNQKSLEKMVGAVAQDSRIFRGLKRSLPPKRKFFKVVTSLENQTVSVDRDLLKRFEARISEGTDLRLSVKNSNLEFWFLLRREGKGFFGVRLTYPYEADKQGARGELRAEIAHLMCVVSDPNPKDIVLDPFAGHGAIPFERAGSFPYKSVIAVEKDKELSELLKQNLRRKGLSVFQGDALALTIVKDRSVDKIITDPPWGVFEGTDMPLVDFYGAMLNEFSRVLKERGLAVVLAGRAEAFKQALDRLSARWEILAQYPVLISGQKATLYKLAPIKRS